MRPRTLAVLAVVVAALAAFIHFYERDLPSSDERAQRAKRVLDLKKDQVTRIRLSAGGQTVVLERQGGAAASKAADAAHAGDSPAAPADLAANATTGAGVDWRIASPAALHAQRADGAAVERLLDSLAGLEKSRTLDQVKPAEVGLDKPRAEVGLRLAGEKEETVLDVGAAVPTGGEAIVAVAGRPGAYVVSDAVMADVQKKAGDWRDHQVFHGDRDAIQRISWSIAGAPRVVLAKRGDNFWLESPLADRADRDQVEKLLTDLTGVSAERFLDPPIPPAAQLGLEPPHVLVEALLGGQPQPFRLDLGSSRSAPATPPQQPGAPETAGGSITYARAGALLFETRSPLADTLAKAAADWRSPLLSGLQVHQVDSAVVRDDHGVLALSRAGTDWKRGAATISYMPVSDLLFTVTEARADRLLTAAEAQGVGSGAAGGTAAAAAAVKPLLTLELHGGQAGNETLTVYPPLGGAAHGVPARASGRDTVLLLPEAKLKEMQDRLAALRAAPPLAPAKPAGK
jgi:hypothetical protein